MTPGSPVIKARSRSKVNKPSGVKLGRRVGKPSVERQGEPRSRQPAKRKPLQPGEGVRGAAGRGGLVECQFAGGKARTTQPVPAGPQVSQGALVKPRHQLSLERIRK